MVYITYDSDETRASSASYYIGDETIVGREKSQPIVLPITPGYPQAEIERQRKLIGNVDEESDKHLEEKVDSKVKQESSETSEITY